MIGLEDIPNNLAEAIAHDDPERQLQFHTSTDASVTTGGRAAAFHGQDTSEEKKTNILRYFRKVDAGLQELLPGTDAPLVLAGVDYLFSIYREANTYPQLLNKGIPGNLKTVPAEILQQQAWEIVQPHFLQAHKDAVRRYGYFSIINQAYD